MADISIDVIHGKLKALAVVIGVKLPSVEQSEGFVEYFKREGIPQQKACSIIEEWGLHNRKFPVPGDLVNKAKGRTAGEEDGTYDSYDVECPHCQTVCCVRIDPLQTPYTQTFICPVSKCRTRSTIASNMTIPLGGGVELTKEEVHTLLEGLKARLSNIPDPFVSRRTGKPLNIQGMTSVGQIVAPIEKSKGEAKRLAIEALKVELMKTPTDRLTLERWAKWAKAPATTAEMVMKAIGEMAKEENNCYGY